MPARHGTHPTLRIIAVVWLTATVACAPGTESPEAEAAALSGDYLGQPPPGPEPVLFAPGVVSTEMDELNAVFSPDGSEFLFAVKTPDRGRHTLLLMEREGDVWSDPRVLPFSGRYGDADPAYSPDGERIYFISQRPPSGEGPPRDNWDLWSVDRTSDGWGEPEHLGEPVNSDAIDVYPSLAADGTLYFSSGREGGRGRNDIYRTRFENGAWTEPENLGDGINTEYSEGDLFVAPDQGYIVFVSGGRPDSVGQGDLYVSFRMPDGSWSEGRNLGETVNSRWTEYCPVVSRDGRYLFFTSYRVVREDPSPEPLTYERIRGLYDEPQSGHGDIYWVDAAVIEELR